MNNHPINFSHGKAATEVYACAGCGLPLFDASKKFEAGCGFPSFWTHREGGVSFNPLNTYGRSRMQLLCSGCGRHLGHLFASRHTPTGVRYCIAHNVLQVQGESFFSKTLRPTMSATQSPEAVLEAIRTHRSSESNFDFLCRQLQAAIAFANEPQATSLACELQDVQDKYATAYTKAKEAGGSAWPEFENFVTQFERVMLTARNHQK